MTLNKVSFKGNNGYIYTADKVLLPLNLKNSLSHLKADNIHFISKNGSMLDIRYAEVDNLSYFSGLFEFINKKIKKAEFSKIAFDRAKFENVTIAFPYQEILLNIGVYEIKNYGLNCKTDQYLQNFDAEYVKGRNYFKIANIEIYGLALGKILMNIQEESSKPFSFIQDMPQLFRVDKISALWSDDRDLWNVQKIEFGLNVDKNGDVRLVGEIYAEHFPLYKFFFLTEIGYLLRSLNYTNVGISGNIQANYTKDSDYWSVTPAVVKIKDLGDLMINAKFKQPASINWSDFKIDPLSPIKNEYNYVFLSVTLQNKGLLQRIIKQLSQEDKSSEADTRLEMLKDLHTEIAEAEYSLQMDAKKVLIGVIKNPTSPIIIDFKSKMPISWENVNDKIKEQQFEGLDITIKN